MEDLQSAHQGRSGCHAVRAALRCPGRHIAARHRAPDRRQPPVGPEPADTGPAEPHRAEPQPAEPQPGGPEPTEPAPAAGAPAAGWRSMLRAVADRFGRWRGRDASDPETPEQVWAVRFTPTWHDWD